MATWEDGPEYAPALRPDHFAEPAAAAPLSAGAPAHPPTSRPSQPQSFERPGFSQPQAPVAPLESLVPPLEDTRDPSMPFEVVSATITEATSAWSAAHWSSPSRTPALPAVQSGPPPLTAVQSGPPALPIGPQPAPFPAPGTTSWFQPAPPPYATASPPPTAGPGAVAQALTPGVLISLVIGGLIWPLAPVAYGIAFALASRVRAGRSGILATFTAGLAVLVVVGVVSALLSEDVLLFFSDWWEFVARLSQALCWAVLLVSCVVVWRALRAAAPGADPPPTVWG